MSRPGTTSRGRNGGYRPYFCFRRNGKTIPAGGDDPNAEPGPAARWKRGRGRGRFGNAAQVTNVNSSGMILPPSAPTFLRSEFFAAPEDAEIVQSITVETFNECPGWRLYFYKENYDQNSIIAKRIKAIEKHFAMNSATTYDLVGIQMKKFFRLDGKIICDDKNIEEVWAWADLMDEMQKRPVRTLATFACAMYSVVLIAANDVSISLVSSNVDMYLPRNVHVKKIYARPVHFCNVYKFAELSSEYLDKLISLRGFVVSVSEVDAAANWICYKCSRCTQEQALRQTAKITSRPYACKRTECHARKGFVELRSSAYTRIKNLQNICLVERTVLDMEAEVRETINIELCHDLVDCIAPGQDLTVIGVLKLRPLTELEQTSGAPWSNRERNLTQIYLRAMTVMDATNVKTDFSEQDLNSIAAIMAEPDAFKLLVHSIAPEVYGQEMAKAGILLALSGGAGTQLHEESEINLLIVGDPGTGKSNMLQMCTRISDRGNMLKKRRQAGLSPSSCSTVATTIYGRAQNGLNFGGITRSLYGHLIIDDIDRLCSEQDTLLQMLQSQHLTLNFSNVYATENVFSSIIVSANPIKGHYDHSKLLTENVRITPSLSSQFHLVFVLCDRPDQDMDASLVDHVQRVHAGAKKSEAIASRYGMKPKNNNTTVNTHSIGQDDDETLDENYELANRLKLSAIEEADIELLPTILIKKFLLCARQEVKPLLNIDAGKMLREFFMNMHKSQCDEKTGPTIGSSQLAGLIRLSQARARLDFSADVTRAHVRDVICIVRQSMADTEVGDYVDLEQSITAKSSRSACIRKFLNILRKRASAVNRRIFELHELKEIAVQAGISADFSHIIDAVNLQGFLLKKGSNIYEMIE